jgi:hypothetical protein
VFSIPKAMGSIPSMEKKKKCPYMKHMQVQMYRNNNREASKPGGGISLRK